MSSIRKTTVFPGTSFSCPKQSFRMLRTCQSSHFIREQSMCKRDIFFVSLIDCKNLFSNIISRKTPVLSNLVLQLRFQIHVSIPDNRRGIMGGRANHFYVFMLRSRDITKTKNEKNSFFMGNVFLSSQVKSRVSVFDKV